MRIGVVFPQTEIGADAGGIRAYAQAVEGLGYTHVLAYDHVLGADPALHQGWSGPYDVATTFHEPFVLFGFLAGFTSLEFVTGVIILPQRQTALVAKQAAEVDLVSGGRFRLGIGVGWNKVEYDGLGEDFTTRGRRSGEQVALLRRLWTEQAVTADVDDEHIVGAGLAPLPIQRPIPVWVGGQSPPAYRRTGRLADGWFPQLPPGPDFDAAWATITESAVAAGRDPAVLGIEARVSWRGDPDLFAARSDEWRAAGATHLGVNTMGAGLATVDEHIAALTTAAAALGL